MYHPAKVQEKIAAGTKTAFLVKTWDKNTFTIDAADDLNTGNVAEGDVVLLDYYPDPNFEMPTPRQVAVAKLDDEQADRIWETYEEMYEDSQAQQTAPMQAQGGQTPFEGGYIG